jgi:peptide/nickel transport system permease protein
VRTGEDAVNLEASELEATLAGPAKSRSLWTRILRVLPWIWITLVLVAGLFGALILGSKATTITGDILQPPSASHLMGTDELGREVFARVVSGAGTSVRVAGLAVVVALLIGAPLGIFAAVGPRWLDELIMRTNDIVLAFPAVALALMVSLLLGPDLIFVALLIGIIVSPHIARLVRGRLASEMRQGYVDAERSTGATQFRILFVHVSRNIAAPIGAYCLLLFADSMLFEAALSYVGVGIQPPTASWGNMILQGQKLLVIGAWWVSVFPGLFLFLTVASINSIGDRWARRIDPLLRQSGG